MFYAYIYVVAFLLRHYNLVRLAIVLYLLYLIF